MDIIRCYRKLRAIIKGLIYKLIYINKIEGNYFSMGRGGEILLLGRKSKIKLGKKNVIRNNVSLRVTNGSIIIGDNTFINDNCCLVSRECITIGNDSLIGQNVFIYDNNHEFKSGDLIRKQGFKSSYVHIGSNVWIGSNTVILPGTIIGDGVVIAAGSIVNGSVPENSVYYNKIVKCIKHI